MKHKNIDDEIDNILIFMKDHSPDSEEYSKAAHNLKELCESRSKRDPLLMNILSIAVPSVTAVVQILLIMNYEKLNIISTKALAWVVKGRP